MPPRIGRPGRRGRYLVPDDQLDRAAIERQAPGDGDAGTVARDVECIGNGHARERPAVAGSDQRGAVRCTDRAPLDRTPLEIAP